MWQPITIKELSDEIKRSEFMMDTKLSDFWNSFKIIPVKWDEDEYGGKAKDFGL